MEFKDRISSYPGRYTMTDENGNVSNVVLERNDEPVQEGTPLNADTFNSMQEAIQIESEDYPGCFYRLVDGKEVWINPPMIPGQWYTTTEQYNGKYVIAEAIEGTLSSSTSDDFVLSMTIGSLVSMTGVVQSTGAQKTADMLPVYPDGVTSLYCYLTHASRKISVPHSAAFAGCTVRATIKYTT